MAQAQRGLDHAGRAGAGLEVTDVGLDRADVAGPPVGAMRRQRRAERERLDGIADRRAGAVRLDVIDVARVHAGRGVDLAQQRLLGFAARHGDAVGTGVLVDARADDERVDRIAVALGLRERFQQHEARPFAADETVGARVEGPAASVRRQHGGGAEGDEGKGAQDDVDATGERHVAFAGPQALAGEVSRHQRGRAGGIDRHARPVQVEAVGDAVGRDALRATGGGVRVRRSIHAHELQLRVVGGRYADVHAGAAAGDPVERLAGVLERFPGHLEQHALLRVDVVRFAR